MSAEILTALTAAVAAVVSAVIAFASTINGRRQNAKLDAEVVKLQTETEHLRSELDASRRRELSAEKLAFEAESKRQELLQSKRAGIYPELLELVYRLRNGFRACLESASAFKPDEPIFLAWHFPGEYVHSLTESLYRYRAFIDEPTFDALHRYKRLVQDVLVAVDRVTRSDPAEEQDARKRRERIYHKESLQMLRDRAEAVDALYHEITERVKAYIEHRSGPSPVPPSA